jgi:hypothetical protein
MKETSLRQLQAAIPIVIGRLGQDCTVSGFDDGSINFGSAGGTASIYEGAIEISGVNGYRDLPEHEEPKNILTCVYCGHQYPEGTPPAHSQILTDHIKVCEKHPMRDAEAKIRQLRSALTENSRVALVVVQALLDTLPES